MVEAEASFVGESYERVSSFLADIDAKKRLGIPIVLGSPSRIVGHALPNWGITVDEEIDVGVTRGESLTGFDMLRSLSEHAYLNEWGDGRPNPPSSWIRAIKDASHSSGLVGLDGALNALIREFVCALILTMEYRENPPDEYSILDIGCGDGKTSTSIMSGLYAFDLIKKVLLRINDISTDCRQRAEKALERFFERRKHKLISLSGSEKDVLPDMAEGSVDIVISNGVFHHFTDESYIKRVKRVLRPGGFIVSGDYHTTVWHWPTTVANFLGHLGADRKVLHEFLSFFKDTPPLTEIRRTLSSEERRANKEMVDFWRALSTIILQRRLSPSPLFEAHESSAQRLGKFRRAGLTTDLMEIMRGFHGDLIDRETDRVRRSDKYRAAPDEPGTGKATKAEILDRGIDRSLRVSPLWIVKHAKGRVYPRSDMARVIVAQKPLKRAA